MSGSEEVGACLRLLRLARQWGLRATAAAARLPLSRLSEIERGKGAPSHARIEAIVGALGYPMLCFELARLLVRLGESGSPDGEWQIGTAGDPERPGIEIGGRAGSVAAAVGVFTIGGGGPGEASGEEIGRCLRVLRRLRARNQRRTAAAAGLPVSRLSEVERGQGRLPGEKVRAVIAGLGYAPVALELVRALVRMGEIGAAGATARPADGEGWRGAAGRAVSPASAGVAVGLVVLGETGTGMVLAGRS